MFILLCFYCGHKIGPKNLHEFKTQVQLVKKKKNPKHLQRAVKHKTCVTGCFEPRSVGRCVNMSRKRNKMFAQLSSLGIIYLQRKHRVKAAA